MPEKAQRVCVVGAGIIGSWAALHLAEAGAETTLLEQFPLPHTRGSSHGLSRAFRYLGDATMDRLDYSMERWQALESQAGVRLFQRTGLLNFGAREDPWLQRHMKVVWDAGKSCQWLDAGEIRERFPQLVYPDEWGAAWDPDGGILYAHPCLAATQNRFRELGGQLVHGQVAAIEEGSDSIKVSYRSVPDACPVSAGFDRVVACAGPWTGRLLPALSRLLTTLAIPVTYWRDTSGQCSAARGFPILFNARLKGVYALPASEYPDLVKVLYHGGPEADPDARDVPGRADIVQRVAAYLGEHLPTLDRRQPAIEETCMYTMTRDSEPIIDRVSGRLVVGCGFSGSGFKHAPATGRMLAALALGTEKSLEPGYELEKYALRRLADRG